MRLLLDTHVLLALLDGQVETLGRETAGLVASGENTFLASVASLWEIAIKWRLGKLRLGAPPDLLPSLLRNMGLTILPITAEHVLTVADPEPATRDPFDRLLLGICQAESLRLVTIDRALAGHRLAATGTLARTGPGAVDP